MRITLILLLILYAVKAHSAEDYVLFIDMNNSSLEVKAAREAAEKSGRKLLVIPELPEKDRKTLVRLAEQTNAAKKQYQKACAGPKVDKAACEEKSKLYEEASNKKSKFADQFKLTSERLDQFLAANKDKSFSSVVISGHDGTGSFSGEFGQLSDTYVAEALGKYPSLRDSIRALHLWGCYTTSPGSLLLNWKKNFPHTSLITGYEGRAPLGDKPAGWHYLKGVLAQEPQLVRAGDSAKLQKLLKKIPGAIQTNSGLYACGEYATLKDHYNIADLQHRCEDIKPQLAEKGPEFDCYLKANEEKCANPPEDVGRGPVRQFYEILHKSSACGEITNDDIFRTYSRDSAIRLVFAREVQKNFGAIYAGKLGEIDEMLVKLGAPERLRFKDIAQLSRREMLQRGDELLAFLRKMKSDPFQDPAKFQVTERDAEIASLFSFQQHLTRVMTQLSAGCVPFSWTEPDQKEKSECVQENLIGLAGVKTQLDPENNLRTNTLSQMSYDLENQVEELEKAAGRKPDAATQAKIAAYEAQMEKLRFYSRFEADKMPPEYLKRIAVRENYAKIMQGLAEQGVLQPKSDFAAVKAVLEINRPEVEAAIKSIKADIKRYEDELKATGIAESDRNYYESRIKDQNSRLRNQEAALEITAALLSDDKWDSTIGKAQHVSELKDGIGQRLRNEDIESKKSTIDSYKKYLGEPGLLNAEDRQNYEKELKAAEEELRKIEGETAAQVRQRGDDYLTKIRSKY